MNPPPLTIIGYLIPPAFKALSIEIDRRGVQGDFSVGPGLNVDQLYITSNRWFSLGGTEKMEQPGLVAP
jgi:hypothetical protein